MGENKKKRSVSRGEFFIKCVLFILDYFLFLIIIPVCGIAYWVATYYSLEKLNDRKSWTIHLKYILIFSSATIFVIKHVARVAIYKFIRDHVKSTVKFFVVSKLYIYLFAVTSTIFFACFFEVKVSAGIVPIFAKVVGYESRTHSISNASDSQSENDSEEKNEDPIVCIILSAVAFLLLLCLKCSPHLAGEIGYVEREDTAEDVFLFPTTMFKSNVLLTEHIGNRFLYFFSSRLYTQIFGIASVSSWYGIWTAFDFITEGNIKITIVIVVISYVGLFCTKTVRNITASPFAVITDKRQGYFDVPTLFQWSIVWKKNKLLYILDSIFSVFIVGTLVILVWRGAWCLLDHTIYPSNYLISGWISLGIGYSIVFATFALQRLMKMLIRKYHGWMRLVIIDTYVVVSFCGTINIWRGIWILLEVYADLEHSLTNCILLHFLSFFILVIFNSSNTLLVRGVYIDAEENGEDCVEFPCYYFRLRFQERQKKKTLVELKMVNNKINLEDDTTLTSDIKKPETEIVTEINPQQVPLIVNNLQNSNGNLNSKLNNEDDKCNL